MEQSPIDEQEQKELDNNPFGADDFGARREREELMKKMRRPKFGQKRSCSSKVRSFMRIFTEQFDASLLLLPGIFYKIGFIPAAV